MAAKSKYITGFCGVGSHEGTKPVSPRGVPLKICEAWKDCSCSCHEQITEMYKLVKMPREPAEQSVEFLAWVRSQREQFHLPSPFESVADAVLSDPNGPDTPDDAERAVATPPDAAHGTLEARPATPPAPVAFRTTPTGVRARGQLEYEVLKVCDEWVNDVYDWPICAPKYIAERIATLNAVEAPSVGAIQAVWDRWVKLGFATYEKKPVRFTGFVKLDTIEQQDRRKQLELLKLKAKRDKKRAESEAKRVIRPRGR